MSTFLSVLVFAAIGLLAGFLATRLFKGARMLLSLILGLIGSFGVSWVAKLLGLGTGFLSISLWGIVAGIVGAALVVCIYGLIAKRSASA